MNAVEKANAVLADNKMVVFLTEVAPEAIEEMQEMVSHYNEFAQCAAPDLYMDEGDYMDATDNERECEWAVSNIKDALETLSYAFRRYARDHFGHSEYIKCLKTPAAKAL